MKNEHNLRQYEMLSAYLDRQLTPREIAQVEAQIKQDSEMRTILEELRRTKQMLRAMPRLRAPRNFTLSPRAAGIHPKKHTYPAYGWVSALATLVLVLTMVGDFLLNRTGLPAVGVTEVITVETLIVESAPAAEEMLDSQAVPPAEQEALAITEEVALKSPPSSTDTFSLQGAQEAPAAEPQPTPAQEDRMGSEASATPTQTPSLTPPATATPSPDISSTPVTEAETGPRVEVDSADSERQAIPPPVVNWLRIFEILLGILAIGTGLAWLVFRRRSFP